MNTDTKSPQRIIYETGNKVVRVSVRLEDGVNLVAQPATVEDSKSYGMLFYNLPMVIPLG